jgi:hypothetical protein
MEVWVRELTFCVGVEAFDAGLLMHGFGRRCWGFCCFVGGVQHGALVRRVSSGRKFRRCGASVVKVWFCLVYVPLNCFPLGLPKHSVHAPTAHSDMGLLQLWDSYTIQHRLLTTLLCGAFVFC